MKLSQAFLDNRELEFISKVLFEQKHLGMGTEVKKFEEELKAYIGSPYHPVVTNTGTSALQLAVQGMGIGKDCEVLVPSLTYVASFQAISATGAIPVACEVHSENALLNLKDAEKRVTKKTKAIMYVHYASHFDNLQDVYTFARKHHLRVIEDAAHSFGCISNGKKIGALDETDTVCFSFDGIKNITCGEGGAIFSTDKNLLQRVSDLRLLGVEKDTEKRFKGERSWEFDVVEQGWRYHMSNIMAAIGRCQLQKFEAEMLPKRLSLSQLYCEKLANAKSVNLLKHDYKNNEVRIIPHIFPVLVCNGKRNELREYLKQFQIECGVHYYPNHLLSFYKTNYSLPETEKFFEEVLTLPLHPNLSEEDINLVSQKIVEFK